VIDYALRNNSATRLSWANARAAAAAYDVARNAYFPTATASGTATRQQTLPSQGRPGEVQTFYGPSGNLSWLLLDLGGRGGATTAARESLYAAGFTHNATLQAVVLQAEQSYFRYMAEKSLVAAQETALSEARTNLSAAEDRHRVGLATIADVLQARTALSQAKLALESTRGDLYTTRGALAVAMGLPANAPYDVVALPDTLPAMSLADSVDALIDQAVRVRPDLAASWAQARASRARVRAAGAAGLPSIVVNGAAGRSLFEGDRPDGDTYTGTVSLQVPLLPGFTRRDNARQARAQADAAEARATGLSQQVVYQVFASYYALETATQRVLASRDLLRSAQQSEDVALARYRAGAGSALDLLSAQSALADARAKDIDARWGWYTALAGLAHDVGVLGLRGEIPFHFRSDSTGTEH
jgi:outer membrane protein TolC